MTTSPLQHVFAHLRPQPAIPAVFVLLLVSLLPRMSVNALEPGALVTWGIPIGLLASAGLALAAGFCSFFPPLIWLVFAWGGPLASIGAAAPAQRAALWVAPAMAIGALGIQAWRVITGRFKPTIERPTDTDS